MNFRVGQRVQCIETWNREGFGKGDEVGPVSGTIYTVRQIGMGLNAQFPSHMQVRLFEIINPEHEYFHGRFEVAFWAGRFRPLVERKNDTAAFIRALLPSKQMEDA